ncbi:MAG: RNA polymerase sigma factor [Planctomycetota bacterium]
MRSTTLHQPERAADLAALAQRHREAVWRWLRVLGADAALADDLTQETFVVVLGRDGFEARDPVAALHFLRATARNLYLRSRRRRTTQHEVEAAAAVWDERCGDGDGGDRLARLRQCVDALPSRSRDLLTAAYAEGCGRRVLAQRFGLGGDGVKSALRRLRAALQRCIERCMEDER